MPTAKGHITIVQEQRFRLATEGGQVLLLTLGKDAALSQTDLTLLRDSGALVSITYIGDPNTVGGAAQAVVLAA
jgi:hypothetical protein